MPIDRYNLVKRNNVLLNAFDEFSPLTVGNGELAFTADPTGFQTFPGLYENGIPLCTLSQWGWHTTPYSSSRFLFDRNLLRMTEYTTGNRTVRHPTGSTGQEAAYDWLRKNPHRLHLGRIGLDATAEDGREIRPADIGDIEQRLDLWEGLLESAYSIEGYSVLVKTCCHPVQDLLAFAVATEFLLTGRMRFIIAFPYGSPALNAADWEQDAAHATRCIAGNANGVELLRIIDNDRYFVCIGYTPGTVIRQSGNNAFCIIPPGNSAQFELNVLFSRLPVKNRVDSFAATSAECGKYWESFWNGGGCIDLAECTDKRAPELERRLVLSQYLTAIQCAGSMPPQETGLTCNSWYGKFHLEMHWWHAAHFALWERSGLLERSLWWYIAMLPEAQNTAREQGYRGARWMKMTCYDGKESPSPIGPLIIWQQPHPIYYAELLYRLQPAALTLEIYKELVFETASFMAAFLSYDEKSGYYNLVPPIIPAQENHLPGLALNPAFELEYWHWGLSTANLWRKRLGLDPDPGWDRILTRLAALPEKDGVYLAHANCPCTFEQFAFDHPSMLAAYGMLAGKRVDKTIMKNTLRKVLDTWQLDKAWGWDFPLMAMTAARLDLPETAVDALLHDSPKNIYLHNGHNRQAPGKALPVYLPGNGGLLTAAGMMAAGWDCSSQGNAPGFPANGKWMVKWEKLRKLP